ncbi:MAG: Clp protease N-terminal domain-containing protein, partial [Polyangiales bacterium]
MGTLTLRLEAYAPDAKQHIAAAQTLADDRNNPEVEPLHLLYRLVEQDETAQAAIERAGVDPEDVLLEAEAELRKLATIEEVPAYLSPRLLDLLGRAEGEAARAGGVPVSSDQLMLGCAQETEGPVKRVLRACGLSAPILRATLSGETMAAAEERASKSRGGAGSGAQQKGTARRRPPRSEEAGDPIEQYGRDLTRLATQGRFDPLVGRDAELRRMLQVLARRRENNPLLVGEPGIGKTAIVQGLATRMARGDVPQMLADKRIVALEMGALVAGAKLRGELEERMRTVLDAVRDSGGEVLLFLPDLG